MVDWAAGEPHVVAVLAEGGEFVPMISICFFVGILRTKLSTKPTVHHIKHFDYKKILNTTPKHMQRSHSHPFSGDKTEVLPNDFSFKVRSQHRIFFC